MDIEEAIRQFRESAINKGDFVSPPSADHRLHKLMASAWRHLHEAGANGQAAFRALLVDESRHVRSWAAAQLLALGDESVVGILKADAANDDLRGFCSEMVLKEWKAGRLEPPFGHDRA